MSKACTSPCYPDLDGVLKGLASQDLSIDVQPANGSWLSGACTLTIAATA
jgi:hypothetical protein